MLECLKLALVQMDIELGNVEANQRKALNLIQEASRLGAKVVALPELWTTGYDLKNIKDLAYKSHDNTLNSLTELAKNLKIDIFTGSIAELDGDNIYNTAYYINSNGEILNKYRKIHLFKLMDEHKYLSSGTELKAFQTEFFKAGTMICYDIRFPELARKLSIDGATILLIPAEFPEPRKNHWRILNMARAIENQVYVVAINRVGQDQNSTFFGSSMIIDPWGEIVAEGGPDEEIIIADIDLTLVDKVRQTIPALKDRKPEYY